MEDFGKLTLHMMDNTRLNFINNLKETKNKLAHRTATAEVP
jgi:hypothetical protein